MQRAVSILGCLLGTAVGDAAGLRREGLSPRRAARMYGMHVSPVLVAGIGLCSDDTEHTMMVARSLALAGGDANEFERLLAGHLKRWILTMPAGVGLATLRASVKLLFGISPQRSGIYSAGNGPAMRSALIGVGTEDDTQCDELVRRSSRITHTDPRAEAGAIVVARAAALAVRGTRETPLEFLRRQSQWAEGQELGECLAAVCRSLEAGDTPAEFAASLGWQRGVTGYVNNTVPAALFCWAAAPEDLKASVTNAVLLGGDTDSVAAITGAIAGANLGPAAIPADWLASLREWPRNVSWMHRLADALAENLAGPARVDPPSMHWPATVPRNLLFAAIVLSLGLRRLLPPY